MDTTKMVRMAAGDPGGGERVLFIEDSPTLAQLLEISLVQAGYQVVKASSGEEGLELARAEPPDLLLCDVMLPGIDGFEVVRQLRRELTTANMSIIMLTAMANVMEGLDAGADDYVLKPYDHRELLARVRSVLRRAKAMRALSPLTGLPGNTRIQEELERAITEQRQFALLYADLDNFKAYNDHYGFARGDDILRLAARLLHGAVQATARPDAFVGHVGGDDFVAITAEEAAKAVVEDLIERFDGEIPSLYDPEDAERGWIEVENRRRQLERYPLVSVSVGVATTATRSFGHYAEAVAI
ncbi:MAG TPA: response regulator, partial [Actinomycetota bacterium]|nr:response regulator [Actinomycetota bacterium]